MKVLNQKQLNYGKRKAAHFIAGGKDSTVFVFSVEDSPRF